MNRPAVQEKKISDNPKKGTPGRDLLRFAGTISPEDCRRMEEAIEAGCERVEGLLGAPASLPASYFAFG